MRKKNTKSTADNDEAEKKLIKYKSPFDMWFHRLILIGLLIIQDNNELEQTYGMLDISFREV